MTEKKTYSVVEAMNEALKKEGMAVVDYPEVIPELRDLLDTLNEKSFTELEKMILREGIRDSVVVWKEKNAILDGHNRINIARKHSLPFPKIEKSFPDVAAAKKWMIENQLGRRNLTPDRFEYFLGTLYNQEKQVSDTKSNIGGLREKLEEKTAAKLASQFGVSERTVRRAGERAVGIDKLEQIRGKIAKQEQLAGKGPLTGGELEELAKTSNVAVGKKMLEKLDEVKTNIKDAKKQVQAQAKQVAKAPETWPVVFCQPDFGSTTFNVNTAVRPPFAQPNSIVYMFVPDAHLADGIRLLEKWTLTYEGAFVFHGGTNDHEGVFSKIVHEFMLVATKGNVIGPKAGKEAASLQKYTGADASIAMTKLIETYHPDAKKLDFRKGRQTKGWDSFKLN